MSLYGAVGIFNAKMDHSWRLWDCAYHTSRSRGDFSVTYCVCTLPDVQNVLYTILNRTFLKVVHVHSSSVFLSLST